jgi:hypothetical protein
MRRWWIAVALTVWLSGFAPPGAVARAPGAGAGSSETATSPTAAVQAPPSWSSWPERLLYRAREYRGNPAWLGIVTGALLVVALGFGVVTLGSAMRGRR